jgi:hypothetical protein
MTDDAPTVEVAEGAGSMGHERTAEVERPDSVNNDTLWDQYQKVFCGPISMAMMCDGVADDMLRALPLYDGLPPSEIAEMETLVQKLRQRADKLRNDDR